VVRETTVGETPATSLRKYTRRTPTHTRARRGKARSDAVAINVRPRLRLTHAGGRHRFLIRAIAARSFVGKYGVLQRWNRSRDDPRAHAAEPDGAGLHLRLEQRGYFVTR
jgi:hypothetical protein